MDFSIFTTGRRYFPLTVRISKFPFVISTPKIGAYQDCIDVGQHHR
jgi:hypothetical protein